MERRAQLPALVFQTVKSVKYDSRTQAESQHIDLLGFFHQP